jgi:hypothetical protein
MTKVDCLGFVVSVSQSDCHHKKGHGSPMFLSQEGGISSQTPLDTHVLRQKASSFLRSNTNIINLAKTLFWVRDNQIMGTFLQR